MGEKIKIIQITSAYSEGFIEALIYGLGQDNRVYFWNREKECWLIDTNKKSEA